MPPQLKIVPLSFSRASSSSPLAAFLVPFLHQQCRLASILASISDNRSAYNKKIRRGRGPSSGKGKTSGRGHKGQKQHGKVPKGFQGGQTPQEIVQGMRGFENQFSVDMSTLNLDTIQSWIDQGRLDPTKPITLKELVESRCLHGIKDDGVKLLGRGTEQFRSPINILVSRASASAIAAVEAAGGSVTTRYYTPFSIRRVLRGESTAAAFAPESYENIRNSDRPIKYKLPDPTSRKDIEYYRDPAHRGYLSSTVPEGEGPSLFFKTPGKGRFVKKKAVVAKGENRIW